MKLNTKTVLVSLVGLAIAGIGTLCFGSEEKKGAVGKVVAVGTIEPAEIVDVYSRVAGTIVKLDADYDQSVKAGAVLAQVDSEQYELRVKQAEAALAIAKAELTQAQAKLKLAEVQLKRDESGKADASVAKFDCEAGKAAVAAAEAVVSLKTLALKEAQLMLGYTTIRSPINGVVLARRVNVGQMVGVSDKSPSLFLIANLKQLQIWASVNETDIGRISEGQSVRFTVDALPDKVFDGKVK